MSTINQAKRHAVRDERLTRPPSVRPTVEPTPLRKLTAALVAIGLIAEPCQEYGAALRYFRMFIEPQAV